MRYGRRHCPLRREAAELRGFCYDPPLQRSCSTCGQLFDIDNRDLAFYDKVSPVVGGTTFTVPPPVDCYPCRLQRQLLFRNERILYRDACDLCTKPLLSLYSAEKPFPVYCPPCWWSDKWDPLTYGRTFEPSRPFFDQLKELWDTVPKLGILHFLDMANSEYTNDVMRLKNCYLVFDGEQAVDCYHGETFALVRDCCDFLFLQQSELCYECVNCFGCYDLQHARFCQNCSSSAFLLDCRGCKHCIGCCNLQQKEYCIFNQQYSQEEFEQHRQAMNLHTRSGIEHVRAQAEAFFATQPKRRYRGSPNEDVTGDNLIGCKDTHDTFDCVNLRDCRYCTNILMGASDCYDVNIWGGSMQLTYNSTCCGEGVNQVIGSFYATHGASQVSYSFFCGKNSSNLFGCIGLRHRQYCILNKQYTKEEYEALAPRIIAAMQADGTWGQFPHPSLSAFAYNETVAQEYFPLSKDQALQRGYAWKDTADDVGAVSRTIAADRLPESIDDIPDDIVNWAIICPVSGRPFRFTKQELDLYRRLRVPVPQFHPDERHRQRQQLRNPRHLWNRPCSSCGKEMKTDYAPEKTERVLCEECYEREVY